MYWCYVLFARLAQKTSLMTTLEHQTKFNNTTKLIVLGVLWCLTNACPFDLH